MPLDCPRPPGLRPFDAVVASEHYCSGQSTTALPAAGCRVRCRVDCRKFPNQLFCKRTQSLSCPRPSSGDKPTGSLQADQHHERTCRQRPAHPGTGCGRAGDDGRSRLQRGKRARRSLGLIAQRLHCLPGHSTLLSRPLLRLFARGSRPTRRGGSAARRAVSRAERLQVEDGQASLWGTTGASVTPSLSTYSHVPALSVDFRARSPPRARATTCGGSGSRSPPSRG